jgi:hypothetical protein
MRWDLDDLEAQIAAAAGELDRRERDGDGDRP